MIKWIDKKSTLFFKGKSFKAGQIVPAGIIPETRLKYFEKAKKIQIGEEKKEDIKISTIMGMEIEAQIMKPVVIEVNFTAETIEDKPKRIYKKRSVISDDIQNSGVISETDQKSQELGE